MEVRVVSRIASHRSRLLWLGFPLHYFCRVVSCCSVISKFIVVTTITYLDNEQAATAPTCDALNCKNKIKVRSTIRVRAIINRTLLRYSKEQGQAIKTKTIGQHTQVYQWWRVTGDWQLQLSIRNGGSQLLMIFSSRQSLTYWRPDLLNGNFWKEG